LYILDDYFKADPTALSTRYENENQNLNYGDGISLTPYVMVIPPWLDIQSLVRANKLLKLKLMLR